MLRISLQTAVSALIVGLVWAGPGLAENDPADGGSSAGAFADQAEALTPRQQAAALRSDLEQLGAERANSEGRQRTLRSEISRLTADQTNLQAALVRTADQLRALNRSIDEGIARLQSLQKTEGRLRADLVVRRAELAAVLATLQRIGRHPPPALAARPSDALGAIRSAILLGAVMPEIREQTDRLQDDLTALETLKTAIGRERRSLETDAERFGDENARLELLLEEKRRSRTETEAALALERKRAKVLSDRADTLNELIREMEKEAALAARRPQQRTQPGPSAAFRAVPFSETVGSLRLPADGLPLRRFGEEDSLGVAARGLSLRVQPLGRIYAPADAQVAYAGPFRSYGEVLILDAGDGYHMVLSGMDRIDVGREQFVLAGEPVGRMGTTRYASAGTIDIQSSDPVLYIEFRKDGRAIDPSPWWATPGAEKVGG